MKLFALTFLLCCSFTVSAADKLQVNLNLYFNGDLVTTQSLQSENGKRQTVTVEKVIKFDVTPTLNDELVTLASVLHKFENGEYRKFQEPKLITKLDHTAVIEVGTESTQVYKIEVTTSKL